MQPVVNQVTGQGRQKMLRLRENEGQEKRDGALDNHENGLYKLKSISVGKIKKFLVCPLNSTCVCCWLIVGLFSFWQQTTSPQLSKIIYLADTYNSYCVQGITFGKVT